MSKSVEVKVDYKAVGKFLKGADVKKMIDAAGAQIAGTAGSGYGHRTHNSDQRSICNIFPETEAAKQDNYENNTLLKALGHLERRPK